MTKSSKTQEFPAFTASQGAAVVNEFETYEDYLDSQITPTDLFYLEDLELARQLVEMGFTSFSFFFLTSFCKFLPFPKVLRKD